MTLELNRYCGNSLPKNIAGGLYETRFFGPGFRIYFTIKDNRIFIFLCGGDKSKLRKDIATTRTVLDKLQEA
jgi:putative addiction module killer protein